MKEVSILCDLFQTFDQFKVEMLIAINKRQVPGCMNVIIKDYFDLCLSFASNYIHYYNSKEQQLTLLNPYVDWGVLMNEWTLDMHFDDFHCYTHESGYFKPSYLDGTWLDTDISHICVLQVSSVLKELIRLALANSTVNNFFHKDICSPHTSINKFDIEPNQRNTDVYVKIGLV